MLGSPNQSRDLEDCHIYLNNHEEDKNHDDPVIKEMLDEWEIGNSFQEDNRAVTVQGKRNNKNKKPNELSIAVDQPSF